MNDNSKEALLRYLEKVSEYAKASEGLIQVAVKLKDTDEWKAFKEILSAKIARDTVQLVHGSTSLDLEDRGKIKGMQFVIDFAEEFILKAMEKKKEVILRKQGKENVLTDRQG